MTRPASPSSNSRHRDKRVPMNSKMYHKQTHTTQADQYAHFMPACFTNTSTELPRRLVPCSPK